MSNPLFDAMLAPHLGSDAVFIREASGDTTTYGAFMDSVGQTVNALAALGLGPGDRLALQVEKSVSALEIYGACLASGIVFLPLNTGYTPDETAYFLNDAKAALFIADPTMESRSAPIAQAAGAQFRTLSRYGQGSFADLVCQQPASFSPVVRAADDLAALLYTSGTTGRSKGAMITQRNLLSNAQALNILWRITSADRLLHALPIFHAHGLFVAVNTSLLSGAEMIFLPGFDVNMVLDWLPRATTMMGVPTFYTRLLEDKRFRQKTVANMRLFISGSAPLLAETHTRFEERTGHRILERYGMTETGMNTSNPYNGPRKPGAVGRPLPGVDVRIVDKSGTPVTRDKIGMIEVRGPNVFKGYWGMSEKTREDMHEDGFFITGDLGKRDKDGYVFIVGRIKDLVITGGYNVYPKEVESLIDEAGWVEESAVIGVPHADFGEAVVAVVVAVPGSEPDLDALRAKLADKLAKYKRPKEIVVVRRLPRNTMGKVQKNVLRDDYADLFAEKRVASG